MSKKQHITTEDTVNEYNSPMVEDIANGLSRLSSWLVTKTTKTVLTKRVVVDSE